MAKLIDLPDEILEHIFRNFLPVELPVSSCFYRREDLYAYENRSSSSRLHLQRQNDFIKARYDLAALARVCKATHTIAVPLLYERVLLVRDALWKDPSLQVVTNRNFHHIRSLYLANGQGSETSRQYYTQQHSIMLEKCSNLQHLVYELHPTAADAILDILARRTATMPLESLSISFSSRSTDPLPLHSLMRVPGLTCLELDFISCDTMAVIPAPSKLLHLRELRISGTWDVAQTSAALAVAEPEVLDVLELSSTMLSTPSKYLQLLKQTFGQRSLARLRSLSLAGSTTGTAETISDLPGIFPFFPALSGLCIAMSLTMEDIRALLACLPPGVTCLSIPNIPTQELRQVFRSITQGEVWSTGLKVISLDFKYTYDHDWSHLSLDQVEGLIAAAKEARQAALSKGIQLKPADLVERLEDYELEYLRRKDAENEEYSDSASDVSEGVDDEGD